MTEPGIGGKVAQERALAMSTEMFDITIPREAILDGVVLTAEITHP